VIPAPFDYVVAEHPDHAIELLGKRDEAKLLAGGHSLLPAMKLRLARPALLIDVGRIRHLSYVREDGDTIAIGALTRHKDVAASPVLQQHCAIVSSTAGQVGDPQVRHRGTIGGSLAHGDPASDLPSVVLAVGGELVARGSDGERAIPASEFFTGVFATALAPDEMLTEIRVPKLGSAGWSYTKMSRRAQDWATVAVAAVVHGNGSVERASVALTNMGATPLHARGTEQALGSGASIEDAAALAAEGTEPPSDHAASSEFRRHLARVLTRRALEEARSR
jgi:carbon-monoxide dehydrogenase medium subunit